MKQSLDQTIIALSTPPGIGAIAMIRISGDETFSIVKKFWEGKDIESAKGHTLLFGRIVNEEKEVLDEVVLGLYRNPQSYTGEDLIEISCHASPYVVQEIISLFLRNGLTAATPGAFSLRAFLNGKMDLSQTEAVADLIASESKAMHRLAMNQLKGGVSNEIEELRTRLIDFASLIELELDFGEEDVEFANRSELKQLVHELIRRIESLILSFGLGNAIKNGVNTVIAGRPNAGKSTLLNALINEDRAIVSDIPGTTRDTIEEIINLHGIQFRVIDTAGIREAQDQIEALGVARTMEKIDQSSILLYVFDVTELYPEHVWADLSKINTSHSNVIVIANKMDLNPYTKPEDFVTAILPRENIITASAKNKMNIEYLKDRLYEEVVGKNFQLPDVIISNARHVDALTKAKERLEAVLMGFETGVTSDFIAMDIRIALYHLGEITGAISTDDLLGNIFGKFCIGK